LKGGEKWGQGPRPKELGREGEDRWRVEMRLADENGDGDIPRQWIVWTHQKEVGRKSDLKRGGEGTGRGGTSNGQKACAHSGCRKQFGGSMWGKLGRVHRNLLKKGMEPGGRPGQPSRGQPGECGGICKETPPQNRGLSRTDQQLTPRPHNANTRRKPRYLQTVTTLHAKQQRTSENTSQTTTAPCSYSTNHNTHPKYGKNPLIQSMSIAL